MALSALLVFISNTNRDGHVSVSPELDSGMDEHFDLREGCTLRDKIVTPDGRR